MSDADARQDLLDALAEAIGELGLALATLGEAYELLDENSQDRLEEQLFGPIQKGYGRAQRTYASVRRARAPVQPHVHRALRRRRTPVTRASTSTAPSRRSIEGEERLIELQDSMMPVTYGDPELRAGLAEVREFVAAARERSHDFMRTLGR